jgi:hypothetical protein
LIAPVDSKFSTSEILPHVVIQTMKSHHCKKKFQKIQKLHLLTVVFTCAIALAFWYIFLNLYDFIIHKHFVLLSPATEETVCPLDFR